MTMKLYREIVGTEVSSHYRANKITIMNPYDDLPWVTIEEERVINIEGEEPIIRPARGLRLALEAGDMLPIIDPTTGEPTGDVLPFEYLYAIMYSAYLFAAQSQDEEDAEGDEQ
jgi:hypothetical protein